MAMIRSDVRIGSQETLNRFFNEFIFNNKKSQKGREKDFVSKRKWEMEIFLFQTFEHRTMLMIIIL